MVGYNNLFKKKCSGEPYLCCHALSKIRGQRKNNQWDRRSQHFVLILIFLLPSLHSTFNPVNFYIGKGQRCFGADWVLAIQQDIFLIDEHKTQYKYSEQEFVWPLSLS